MYAIQNTSEYNYADDEFYSIRVDIANFDNEKYELMVGDTFTIIYAFMVLFTGAASDVLNRKKLLCGSCFCWCLCIYLCSFTDDFWHLYILRLIMCLFNAFAGPCSYSLITDWIHPSERTLAYSLYALGVQFGGPASLFNTMLIEWLGWRATFQFLGLLGFVSLALAVLSFDEPDRGRFDISASVVVHHKSQGSMYSQQNAVNAEQDPIGYDLSGKNLKIRRLSESSQNF